MKTITKEFKISEVGQKDFPELEGKTIIYEYPDGDTVSGVVVGCNLDVGITVVDADDKDHYLMCITGAVVPGGGNMHVLPETVLIYTIEALQLGHFKIQDAMRAGYVFGAGNCTGSNCAYGQ